MLSNRTAFVATLASLAWVASTHAAVVMSGTGTSDPTPGVDDQSQLVSNINPQTSPFGSTSYVDQVPPGQTFTTGANAGGYTFDAYSFKTSGDGNAYFEGTWNLRISQV